MAHEATRAAAAEVRVVSVEGPSGIGKSALIRRFLDAGSVGGRRPRIFSGRCYEHESLPFKALDPLLDDMGQDFARRSDVERRQLLGPDIAPLAQLFPVLQSFFPPQPLSSHSPLDRTREAARALGLLLRRLAAERPLILWIDDLQWGDAESATLLGRALADATGVLVIASFRPRGAGGTGDGAESADVFMAPLEAAGFAADAESAIHLRPLRRAEALEVARGYLPQNEALAELVARESKGSPYLLTEIALYLLADPGALPESGAVLDEMLRRRMHELDRPALRLLETIAVAGRPLPLAVAYAAAGVAQEGPTRLGRLRAEGFVQTVARADAKQVDTYHDRIRETLCGHLERNRNRSIHRRLAEAMQQHSDAADRDARRGHRFSIAHHYAEAGRFESALPFALEAAESAVAGGSPEAAERYYRIAEAGLDAAPRRLRRVVLEGLGGVLMLRGDYDGAEERLQNALFHTDSALGQARLAGRLGELAFRRGRLGDAEAVLERALRRLGAPARRRPVTRS